MKSSERDKRLDELISQATGREKDVPVADFDRWLREHPRSVEKLRTQSRRLLHERFSGSKCVSRESLLVRFPSHVWVGSLAGLFIIFLCLTACCFLIKRVSDLEHQLELARRDILVARTEGKLEEARSTQRETISTLNDRVEELEDRIPRISSPSRVYYPEEAYYFSKNRGNL